MSDDEDIDDQAENVEAEVENTEIIDRKAGEMAEFRRIYAPPTNFDGTQEEFNVLTANLEPFHCSYPEGQHLDPRTGLPCRRRKGKHGNCEIHVRASLPSAIGDTTPRMRERLEMFFEDLHLESSRTNLAVSEMVLQERLAMLDTSESKSFMEMIESASMRAKVAIEEMEPLVQSVMIEDINNHVDVEEEEETRGQTMQRLLGAIQSAIDCLHRGSMIRKRKHDSLEALSRANVESVRVKESASKMDQDRGRVVSKEHATRMTIEVIDLYLQAIERFIDDPAVKREMLSFVHEGASRLRSGS